MVFVATFSPNFVIIYFIISLSVVVVNKIELLINCNAWCRSVDLRGLIMYNDSNKWFLAF